MTPWVALEKIGAWIERAIGAGRAQKRATTAAQPPRVMLEHL
jgi:hypothetical protein